MRFLIAFIFTGYGFFSFSQDTIYLKQYSDTILVPKNEASYFKILSRNGNILKVDFFDINGTIITTEHFNELNFRVGEYFIYQDGGKVYMKGTYSNNNKNGVWITYNKNGSIEKEENYLNGFKNGTSTYYVRGKPERIYEYSYDKIVRKTCVDSLGHHLDCDSLFLTSYSIDSSGIVYDHAEITPQFPGGAAELMKFLQLNIHYPSEARQKGLEGKVVIKFIVDQKGYLKDATVLFDGIGGGCSQEALRVINLMPRWTPAVQNNKFVKCSYVLPVTFKLQ